MVNALKLSDIAVARGGLPVLEGVSLSVGPGEALVLRGPNGSGKTTLLRTVAGLQLPIAGRIEGAGDRVAYAAHADGVKDSLTVTENLRFWAGVYGADGIEDALRVFDLQSLTDRQARALSAGQRRRLGLARLLVTGRPLWVLDEPTVSLDRASVGLFADATRAHLGQGGSALIATHIDLGLDAAELDVTPFKATEARDAAFDEAFL